MDPTRKLKTLRLQGKWLELLLQQEAALRQSSAINLLLNLQPLPELTKRLEPMHQSENLRLKSPCD